MAGRCLISRVEALAWVVVFWIGAGCAPLPSPPHHDGGAGGAAGSSVGPDGGGEAGTGGGRDAAAGAGGGSAGTGGEAGTGGGRDAAAGAGGGSAGTGGGSDAAAGAAGGTAATGGANGGAAGGRDAGQEVGAVCGDGIVEPPEDCEPPQQSYSPGHGSSLYCGPACKLIDACEACKTTCAGAGCDDFTGAERTACLNAEQCFTQCLVVTGSTDHVDFERCYCGGVDHTDCIAGGAVGICRPQIEAAAGTADGSAIFAQVGTHTPLGVGLSLESCVGNACGFSVGCATPAASLCGNGVIDPGETCDPPDGIQCSVACTQATTVSPTQAIDTCMTRAPDPSWTSESAGTVASALWATAPDDAWIALAAEVSHFDGASWTTARVFEPGESFSSVWGSSITDAWVGSTRALTRWNGTSWEDLLPFGIDLVWGVGPGDVWATRAGRIFHWIGSKWREESLPSGLDASTVRIWSLAGVATDDVWAFGSAGVNPAVGLALHWNGSTWSEVDDGTGLAVADRVFESAWASSADDLWMSGVHYPSATELWHWDGVSWTEADASAGGTFGALAGTATNDVWSIGADAGQTGATLRHFDGSAWSTVSIGDRSLSLLAASRADDVWSCGSTGQGSVIYHLHHPCNDAAPAPVFTRASAVAVFRTLVALAPTALWGMDPNGGLADWDGAVWSRVTSPFPASVSPIIASIAGWAPNALWVAGADVMRWDGSAWSDMTPPNPSGYNHNVWGGGANDVWVEQANLFMFHWDGSAWLQTDFQGSNVNVAAMASDSATDAWALGVSPFGTDVFAHWNGATWTIRAGSRSWPTRVPRRLRALADERMGAGDQSRRLRHPDASLRRLKVDGRRHHAGIHRLWRGLGLGGQRRLGHAAPRGPLALRRIGLVDRRSRRRLPLRRNGDPRG